MPREASFWQMYAEANDDIRHQLVERGWSGREVTGNDAQEAVIEAPEEEGAGSLQGPDHEGTVWAQENAEGIHSAEMQPEDAPQIEAPEIGPEQE